VSRGCGCEDRSTSGSAGHLSLEAVSAGVDKKPIFISDAATAAGGGGGVGASDMTRMLSLQPSRHRTSLVQRNLRPASSSADLDYVQP